MGKKRPNGGRPPGRRGRGGVGPGPGYKPNPNTGGSKHKGHTTGGCMLAKAVGAVILGFLAAAFIGTTVAAFS